MKLVYLVYIAILFIFMPEPTHAEILISEMAPEMVCKSKSYTVLVGKSDLGPEISEGVIYRGGTASVTSFEVKAEYDATGNVSYDLGTFLELQIKKTELKKLKRGMNHVNGFLQYTDGPADEHPSEYATCLGILN